MLNTAKLNKSRHVGEKLKMTKKNVEGVEGHYKTYALLLQINSDLSQRQCV